MAILAPPMACISESMRATSFSRARRPRGRKWYRPEANWRITPACNISCTCVCVCGCVVGGGMHMGYVCVCVCVGAQVGFVWVMCVGGWMERVVKFGTQWPSHILRLIPYDLSQLLPAMASSLKEGKGRRWSRVPVSSWHLYQYRCSSSSMVERAAISLALS